jgi:anti-sigma factor ChrR (cupin superfamily)
VGYLMIGIWKKGWQGRDDERVLLEDDDDVYVWMMKASSRCIHTCSYTHTQALQLLSLAHTLSLTSTLYSWS